MRRQAGVSQAGWLARRLGGSVTEASARVCVCMHTVEHIASPSGTCGSTTGRAKQLQLEPCAVRTQPLPPGVEAVDEPLTLEGREDGDAQLDPTWLAAGRSPSVSPPSRRSDPSPHTLSVELKVELSRVDKAPCRLLVGQPRERNAKTAAIGRGVHAKLHRGAICRAGKLEQRIV